MNEYTLPDVLPAFHLTKDLGCMIYDHQPPIAQTRTRLTLTFNTITLIDSGAKHTDFFDYSDTFDCDTISLYRPGNCITTDVEQSPAPYRAFVFFFSDEFFRNLNLSDRPSDIVQQNIKFTPSDQYIELFRASIRHLFDERMFQPAMMRAKTQELLEYLSSRTQNPIGNFFSRTQSDPFNEQLRVTVKQHLFSQLTIDELAFLCHMSPSTFKRRFREQFGESPGKWFSQKRLEKAIELMIVHHRRPSDIFFELGYASHASFSEAFRKKYGISPSEYTQNALTKSR